MKKLLTLLMAICACVGATAATISSSKTWVANEQVTAASLNGWPGTMNVSLIQNADIAALTIDVTRLGPNCVTTDKILNGTILGDDIKALTLTGSLMATGTVNGVQLATNLNLSTQSSIAFATNVIGSYAVAGVTNGPGTLGQVVKLNASGLVDKTLASISGTVTETNLATYSYSSTYNWEEVCSLTTSNSSGVAIITGRVAAPGAVYMWVRVRNASGTVNSINFSPEVGGVHGGSASATITDVFSTNTTYYLDVAASSSTTFTNAFSTGGNPPAFQNALGLRIMELK